MKDKELFKTIFMSNDIQLFELLRKVLKSIGYTIYSSLGNYIYAVGEIPIALVAHIDTVWNFAPYPYYNDKYKVLYSKDGLGADDRAGVVAILKILSSGLRPSIIFTLGEEIGGIGAQKLVSDFPFPVNPINYIIELDRHGNNDACFYNCTKENFQEYIINNFKFIKAEGIFSDIYFICPKWNIAGVNLSIGYYNEHTKQEYLDLTIFYKIITRVKQMLKAKDIPSFTFFE